MKKYPTRGVCLFVCFFLWESGTLLLLLLSSFLMETSTAYSLFPSTPPLLFFKTLS